MRCFTFPFVPIWGINPSTVRVDYVNGYPVMGFVHTMSESNLIYTDTLNAICDYDKMFSLYTLNRDIEFYENLAEFADKFDRQEFPFLDSDFRHKCDNTDINKDVIGKVGFVPQEIEFMKEIESVFQGAREQIELCGVNFVKGDLIQHDGIYEWHRNPIIGDRRTHFVWNPYYITHPTPEYITAGDVSAFDDMTTVENLVRSANSLERYMEHDEDYEVPKSGFFTSQSSKPSGEIIKTGKKVSADDIDDIIAEIDNALKENE